MSTRIRLRARTPPLNRATTSMRVVTGRRMAKTIGFMAQAPALSRSDSNSAIQMRTCSSSFRLTPMDHRPVATGVQVSACSRSGASRGSCSSAGASGGFRDGSSSSPRARSHRARDLSRAFSRLALSISAIRRLHPLHLPAHGRAVGRVEGQERFPLEVARGREVGFAEGARQVAPVVGDQLHHQERHVGHRIGRAEGLVELDAVDDEDILREEDDRETDRRDRAAGRRACRRASAARPGLRSAA